MALVWTVVALGVVARAWTWATPERVAAWAARRGLDLDAGGLAHLAGYLRTVRRCRTTGWVGLVALSVVLPSLGVELLGVGYVAGVGLVPPVLIAVVGAAGGTAAAEWLLARAHPGQTPAAPRPPAAARLRPRQVGDYTAADAGWVAALSAVTFAAAVALHRLGQVLAPPNPFVGPPRGVDDWLGVPLLAVLVVLGLEVLRRWIVARPQPAGSADVAMADDAGRVAQVQMVVGLQVATGFFAAAQALTSASWFWSGAVWDPVTIGGSVVSALAGAAALVRYGPGTAHTGGPDARVAA